MKNTNVRNTVYRDECCSPCLLQDDVNREVDSVSLGRKGVVGLLVVLYGFQDGVTVCCWVLVVLYGFQDGVTVTPSVLGWSCCKKWALINVSGVRTVSFFPDCLIERLEVGQYDFTPRPPRTTITRSAGSRCSRSGCSPLAFLAWLCLVERSSSQSSPRDHCGTQARPPRQARRIIRRQAKMSVHHSEWSRKPRTGTELHDRSARYSTCRPRSLVIKTDESQEDENTRRLSQLVHATGDRKPPVSETIKDQSEAIISNKKERFDG
ncbi:hypothetical protein T265_06198 [Opisthorchis viverrini]|uniref:Uncharacterized protein n=1 Tax=Opisthorchis viverrini TaxID=6198 RepID=A0A075AE83_OPIVI|nr:hypothetical protein T265_06198 [Opisthorchis viverrini]KER26554.1 hypothetical protein T265_06198 [Opisthorchis viverrini]